MSNKQERVVIRRKKNHGHAHHGGSWKIAYADFVTAMMSFFLVMWLLSLVPGKDLKVIAEYFRMPLLDAVTGGSQTSDSDGNIPGGSPTVVPNPFSFRPNEEEEMQEDQRDLERLEELKQEIESLIEASEALREFRSQLVLDMTPDGLRIQIVDRDNRPMFALGSAQLQPYMRGILHALGPTLNKVSNPLNISGHTDARQYATGERRYSNWELSADRANAARQELVAGGLNEARVRQVMGLSSTMDLVKDNPYAAVNRRISIVILNRLSQRRLDEGSAVRGAVSELEKLSREVLQDGGALLVPDGAGLPGVALPDAGSPDASRVDAAFAGQSGGTPPPF